MLKAKIVIGLITTLLICSRPTLYSIQARPVALTKIVGVTLYEINLPTRDLIYDPVGSKIYASIPSTVISMGNSIVPIDAQSGKFGKAIFVGSEPNRLAVSNNGQYLYAGLDGAAAVRQVDLISQTAELQFSLGILGACGNYLVEDMLVLADNPHAVAISLRSSGCDPHHQGVAIYEDGVPRPDRTPGFNGSNVIELSDSPSVLYGQNNEYTEMGFRIMSVSVSGVSITSNTKNMLRGFGVDIRFDNGLIYATDGSVIDPHKRAVIGKFNARGSVCPDSERGRVYFLTTDPTGAIQLEVFNQATYAHLATLELPQASGTPGRLVKTGYNSLAFRTDKGQVFLLEWSEQTSIYLPLVSK